MENKIIQSYINELLKKEKREDDRELLEYRSINIELNPIDMASGSARVRIGKTDVIVGVKMDVAKPFPDTPDDGILICNAELFPFASPDLEPGPPGFDSIELARVTDRAIRESHAIDMKKLCITPEEKVWAVYIDIAPINHDGNLFDAAVLGAITALKNAYFPKYDEKEGRVLHEEKTKEKLPLKNIPIMCTFGKVNGSLFLYTTRREEQVFDARLGVATIQSGNLCAMQKGGQGSFSEEEIWKMIEVAVKKGKELRKLSLA